MKTWTFIIGKELSRAELDELQRRGNEFVRSWTAHENSLDGRFAVYRDRIIIVTVNEAQHAASGCSIDKLTRFMKETGERFGIDLLDRMQVVLERDDRLDVVKAGSIRSLVDKKDISAETVIYDLSSPTGADPVGWRVPLSQSWTKKYLAEPKA